VLVNFSHGEFSLLFTHDNLVIQALVCLGMLWDNLVIQALVWSAIHKPKKKIVLVNFSHGVFPLLFTHDNLVIQALVCLGMLWDNLVIQALVCSAIHKPKKKIVLVNFSHGVFPLLFTHDNLVIQALVCLGMLWFVTIWFGASYANLK